MKKALLFIFYLLSLDNLSAQSTICTELWSTGAPVSGTTITATVHTSDSAPVSFSVPDVSCTTLTPDMLTPGSTLSYAGSKDVDDLNGVTVLDLVAIQSHILGIYPLTAPFGYFAADVNRSGSITAFDIVEAYKLILGYYQEFPNNTSWRFIPGNCYFPNPVDPFGTNCYTLPVDLLQDSLLLTGVKVGDVDGDAGADVPFAGPTIFDSTALYIPDVELPAGVPTTIEIKLAGHIDLTGLQTEFVYDAGILQFNNAEPTLHFTTNSYVENSGKITAAGFDALTPMVPGEVVMKLNFTANASVQLSDVFSLNPSIVHSMGALGNAPPRGVKLRTSTTSNISTGVSNTHPAQLSATIYPNPFSTQTTFTLQLDAPETVRLEIFNLSGQRQYFYENHLPAGVQLLNVPQEALAPGTAGYYRLQAGNKWASGKLVRF